MSRIPRNWLLYSFAIALWLTSGHQARAQGATPPSMYSNPALWQDLPDLDILRVGNEDYYSASNKPLGTPFVLNDLWQLFMGYRFGIFNCATKALGGAVSVLSSRLQHGN